MKTREMKAYAKINLSLDVLGKRPDGYHEVEMIMQQIMLHDLVTVSIEKGKGIEISVGDAKLPTDEGNIAYRAALQMLERAKQKGIKSKDKKIKIDIEKRIPLAAGLAGGSADAAAVVLALDDLWQMNLAIEELKEIAETLGQDVVFALLCQRGDCHAAFAKGAGAELEPLEGVKAYAVLSKPSIGVSTKEVYEALDKEQVMKRPNTENMLSTMRKGSCHIEEIAAYMINVMEIYTLKKYPQVRESKMAMEKLNKQGKVLMSGSGPTIYLLTSDAKEAQTVFDAMKRRNKETYLSKTQL